MRITRLLTLGLLLLVSASDPAEEAKPPKSAAEENGVQVYFSPMGGCTDAIVYHIGRAKKSVLVAAYTITSTPIAKAINDAHKRGVEVKVCLDPSQATVKYSSATYLHNAGIEVWIDRAHGLQHNKYIVIDGSVVITGSFNFSQAAEERNAENLLVIKGKKDIVDAYAGNFASLLDRAKRYERAAE